MKKTFFLLSILFCINNLYSKYPENEKTIYPSTNHSPNNLHVTHIGTDTDGDTLMLWDNGDITKGTPQTGGYVIAPGNSRYLTLREKTNIPREDLQ